jgi:hypothetical protein
MVLRDSVRDQSSSGCPEGIVVDSSAYPNLRYGRHQVGNEGKLGDRRPPIMPNRFDVLAGVALVLCILVVQAPLIIDPLATLAGDNLLFFIPYFTFLGEQLRAGNIPSWNPHQFAGAPFAADPQSGWMSFLPMAAFTFLSPISAILVVLLAHQIFGAVALYAFARMLGLTRTGAFAAGAIFSLAAMWQRTLCCSQVLGVQAWLPVMLLAVEGSLRSQTRLARVGWLMLGGLAVSQELAIWLGQGSYYQMLIVGGWLGFRTLLWPMETGSSVTKRVSDFAISAALLFGAGLLLNAAALVPRLEFNQISNVAGGVYQGPEARWAAEHGGFDLAAQVVYFVGGFFSRPWLYAGAAGFGLALLCPMVARRWRPWIFFAAVIVAMSLLSLPEPTLLERPFRLLPGFETLHSHYRERISYTLALPIGLLAGASVSAMTTSAAKGRWIILTPLIVVAGAVLLWRPQSNGEQLMSAAGLACVAAAMLIYLLAKLLPATERVRSIAALSIAAVLVWDPAGYLLTAEQASIMNAFATEERFLPSDGAAAWLAQREGANQRYFGFDPGYLGPALSTRRGYPSSRADLPISEMLVAGNQGTLLGIDDLQGYNPVHPMRYVEWVRSLNGLPQLYRFGNVFPSGIDSPLLDLINARYAIVPADRIQSDQLLTELRSAWNPVYEDGTVTILENPEAAPRAWLVGEARQAAYGEALDLLASGAVDGRRVALVEDKAAVLPAGDSDLAGVVVSVARPNSDRLDLMLAEPVDVPAMLVVSEVWDPNWTATADGQTAPVHVVDHTLMGVRLEPGAREIVLRYEPRSLRIGLAVSTITGLAMAAIWIACGMRAWRRRTE